MSNLFIKYYIFIFVPSGSKSKSLSIDIPIFSPLPSYGHSFIEFPGLSLISIIE